jgi:hypothetical protein
MRHQVSFPSLIAALALGLVGHAQTAVPQKTESELPKTISAAKVCGGDATYQQLTRTSNPSTPPQIAFGQTPVELTISAIEFSDQLVDAKTASSPFFCEESTLVVGVNVSTAGELASFMNGEGAFRGGGGGKLSPEDFSRLESLMDELPDGRGHVPPPTRRIMVTVQRDGAATTRLYDSAHLPDAIIEMIRLTGARIRIQAPVFQPDKIWTPDEARGLDLPPPTPIGDRQAGISLSPDGSISVMHDFSTKTLTVYEGMPQLDLPQGGKVIRVLPEFWQPPVYGGYWVNTEFSPDGRYLLATWGRIGALLYSTSTWQPVTDPHLFPQNLKEYIHSPNWEFGIAVTESGETLVWDEQAHRVLSKLPGLGEFELPPVVRDRQGNRIYTTPNAEIQSAAFSPDHSRVAIFSGPDDIHKLRLSVWAIQSGQKLREFWPAAWSSYPSGQPLWWDEGQLLVAPYSSEFSGSGIGIWDAETGRFEGELGFAKGCDRREDLMETGQKLLQRCFLGKDQEGSVMEWSVEAVRKQLEAAAN